MRSSWFRATAAVGAVFAVMLSGVAAHPVGAKAPVPRHTVTVPEADKFTPFAITVHVGDVVTWVNRDTDDHTVVSDDAFNTAGHKGLDQPLPGTDSNGGKPGTFQLRFNQPGTFVYFCRFHAHLDGDNQPVAPGPEGGIQDAQGNFGTPMMGIVTVLGQGEGDNNNG